MSFYDMIRSDFERILWPYHLSNKVSLASFCLCFNFLCRAIWNDINNELDQHPWHVLVGFWRLGHPHITGTIIYEEWGLWHPWGHWNGPVWSYQLSTDRSAVWAERKWCETADAPEFKTGQLSGMAATRASLFWPPHPLQMIRKNKPILSEMWGKNSLWQMMIYWQLFREITAHVTCIGLKNGWTNG